MGQRPLREFALLGLKLARDERPLEVLALGAHPDDIEIGCGGALANLISGFPGALVRWVVFSGDPKRHKEAVGSADDFLSASPRSRVDLHGFRDGYFPYEGAAIKDRFESLKADCKPALVFTHWAGDAHQDHRVISELTFNTFRDHLILEYEIPKIEGDLGNPHLFLPLTAAQLKRKTDRVLRHFPSQVEKRWFTAETFSSLARLRGIACNAPEGYAEAFYIRKAVIGP